MIERLRNAFDRLQRHPFFMRITQPPLLRWRTALVTIALIHLVGGALLLRLDLNNAPGLYFPDQAPATVLERELRREFPNDEFLIGLFQGDNLFDAERLKAIDQVADDMARHPNVGRVFSVLRSSLRGSGQCAGLAGFARRQGTGGGGAHPAAERKPPAPVHRDRVSDRR